MSKRRFSLHHLLPGLSLAFTLCIFAPVDLYLTSAEDLWFSLEDLILWLAAAGAAILIAVTLLSWLLPQKLSVAFRAAVYACSFLAWLQGNVLILDYGVLDGRKIDWSSYRQPIILDTLLWLAVITLFIFLMFRFRKKFRRIVETAACILLATQVIFLSVSLIRQAGQQKETPARYLSRSGEFTVSAADNTIVFVLDTFDSHIFENLRQKYPEKISSLFEDFTFYPDTVGGATRTKVAMPFIFTGTVNTEEQSYTEYLSNAFASSPLIREMATGKYDTGVYSVSHYYDLSRDDAIGNIEDGVPVPSSRFQLTKQFLKLTAFRYAPSVLARFFWTYTGVFDQFKSSTGASAYGLNDAGFYHTLTTKTLSASAEKPCFRFYHLSGAHEPYVLDENSQKVAIGESDEERQCLGVLNIVSEYLDQLSFLGLYDQATVLILADHGYGVYSSVEQSPLFMVKFSGNSHPFDVSDLPLSYASLPEIMTSALKGTLISLEPWRASSPRYFYQHREKNYVTNIIEYAIDGHVWNSKAKKTGVEYHENTLNRSRNYVPGTELYFDERDTARNYLVSGFSRNEGIYTWTYQKDAELLFSLPAEPEALSLTMTHGTYDGEQTVEVYVNDQLLETYTASGKTTHTVHIPAGTVESTELQLRLHLPDARSPASLGKSSDGRTLALSMISLVISEEGK